MKNAIVFVLLLIAQNSFAGGITGAGPGDKMTNFSAQIRIKMPIDNLSVREKLPGRVYYMRQKQAEIQFATNTPGDKKVEIQSLRPEEIGNPALLEGLKRSQQSRQWENVKLPKNVDFDQIMKQIEEPK